MSSPRSRFTPSLMSHDLLERLFVAREQTLDRILDRVEAAATSDERNHTLLVGPRGSGKTHLISLAYYRTRDLDARLQLAWLPEDPWTIVSYQRLLREIAERLEPAVDDVPSAAPQLEALLVARARSDGPIVVFLENLDQILDALGNKGQQQLRHLLQAHRPFLFVASSTRIDRSLSDQAEPFYGWFTTTRLEPFDANQAAAMLTAIAAENGDEQLVAYLDSDEGRRRLQTIAHLAGGQPRIWALLSAALDVAKLGDLVDLLLTRFDDLTPYYQEQLGRLSPQQRLIVAELAGADRPMNVADLAQRLELNQRSLSKTVSELVERGWMAPTTSALTARLDRRRTYYELAEPLARLSFQIKEARGEPLKLVIEFLKHWLDPDESEAPVESVAADYFALAAAGQDTDPVVAVTRRLSRLPMTRAPAVGLLGEIDDALAALSADDAEPMIRLPTPVRAALEDRLNLEGLPALRERIHRAALDEFGTVRHPDMDAWIDRAERWIRAGEDDAAPFVLVVWLARAWRFDEAEQAAVSVREQFGADLDRTALLSREIAVSYEAAGRIVEAVSLLEQSIDGLLDVRDGEDLTVLTLSNDLADAYLSAGRSSDALELYAETVAGFERTSGAEDPSTLAARNNLAVAHLSTGRGPEAVQMQERTLAAHERVLGPNHPGTIDARHNLGSIYATAGQFTDAVRELELALVQRESVLGIEHPKTLVTQNALTLVRGMASQSLDMLPILQQTLSAYERLYGSEHPRTLTMRVQLARAHLAATHTDDAILLFEQALATYERVLGDEHPLTIGSRDDLARARGAGRPSPPTDPAPALDPR